MAPRRELAAKAPTCDAVVTSTARRRRAPASASARCSRQARSGSAEVEQRGGTTA